MQRRSRVQLYTIAIDGRALSPKNLSEQTPAGGISPPLDASDLTAWTGFELSSRNLTAWNGEELNTNGLTSWT